MDVVLNDKEARVLGSLIEKQLGTPEYYPLSLNALTIACNQKSNRQPVVAYDEETVQEVAEALIQKGLVSRTDVGRVPKYEECFTQKPNFIARESALLCVLLLRGPQTPGAIRARTTRLCSFENLDAVQETLDNLEQWGFIKRLARLPGHKECRYMHCLGGEPELAAMPAEEALPAVQVAEDEQSRRIDQLQHEVAALKEELEHLKAAFQAFKRQFD